MRKIIIICASLFIVFACGQNYSEINKEYLGKYIYLFNEDIYVEIELLSNKENYKAKIIGYYNAEEHGILRYFSIVDKVGIEGNKISFNISNRRLTNSKVHLNDFDKLITSSENSGEIGGIKFNGIIQLLSKIPSNSIYRKR